MSSGRQNKSLVAYALLFPGLCSVTILTFPLSLMERSETSFNRKSNLTDPYSMVLRTASTQAVATDAQDDKQGIFLPI